MSRRCWLVSEQAAANDAAEAFFEPFLGVAFLLVDGPGALGGELGFFDFLKAFVADIGEPALEGFRIVRGDGLDQAEVLRGVRYIGQALVAGGGGHFQTVTICNGFISLIGEALFSMGCAHFNQGTICLPVGI